MGTLTVIEHLTLDGVLQAPGRTDEDTRDGFVHGGWGRERDDPAMAEAIGACMPPGWSLLAGRVTYEDLYTSWAHPAAPNSISASLNAVRKYVVSGTLTEPLAWANATLLDGDPAEAVAALLDQGATLVTFGSAELVRTLAAHDLVDRYLLMTHPIVLGSGRRMFTSGYALAELELEHAASTPTGVVVATYRPLSRRAA